MSRRRDDLGTVHIDTGQPIVLAPPLAPGTPSQAQAPTSFHWQERAELAEAERDRLRAAIQQIREAKRGLDAAIIASAHWLDEPFTDRPEMSPWKVCKLRMKALDDAVKAALDPQERTQ